MLRDTLIDLAIRCRVDEPLRNIRAVLLSNYRHDRIESEHMRALEVNAEISNIFLIHRFEHGIRPLLAIRGKASIRWMNVIAGNEILMLLKESP